MDVEALKAALRRERNKRAEVEQARDVALSRIEQLLADNERTVEQTVRMKIKSEKLAQKALANSNKKSRQETIAVKKELSYLRTTGQERVNKARQERDVFERQVRNVTEKLRKANVHRRTLKESLATEKRASQELQEEYDKLLQKKDSESELQSQEAKSIKSVAQRQLLAEKQTTQKLASQKQRLKKRLQESREEVENAKTALRVELRTTNQLRADITHRAKQFKQLKEQISCVQKELVENSGRTEAEKSSYAARLAEAKKVENTLRAALLEERTMLETAQRLIDREQEVAKMLRKDILSLQDEVAALQDQLGEGTKRTVEVGTLLQQRQDTVASLQGKLDDKLEGEKTLLARLKTQASQFQKFELDTKSLEEKLTHSQEDTLKVATRLKRLEDALHARNISPEFLLAPVAVKTDFVPSPSEERPPAGPKYRTARSTRRSRHSAGARSDSALTDKSFKSASRPESHQSRRTSARRSRSNSRQRKSDHQRSSSSGDAKHNTPITTQNDRRHGWQL